MNWRSVVWKGGRPHWPGVVLVVLSLAVLVTVGLAAATSTTAFGPYSTDWDGANDLRTQVETGSGPKTEFVTDTSRYQTVDPETTVAFVIAPDEPYEGAESERVREFVENGGTLVVLEDFGQNGNDLLSDIGADARLDGDLLQDEQSHYQSPTMPVATGVTNHTLTEGVDQLTLNYATAVKPGNATVLVRTGEFAYLTESADEELDDDDELGAYPVATVEDAGDGEVVVVGDPSITVNAMLTRPDNAAFLEQLYTREDRVLFDISHSTDLPPLRAAALALRGSSLLQLVVGGLGIVGVLLLSNRQSRALGLRVLARLPLADRWKNRRQSGTGREPHTPVVTDEKRVRQLRQRHPDWDEERIQRVTEGLNTPASEDTTRDR